MLIFALLIIALVILFLFFMKKKNKTIDVFKKKIEEVDFSGIDKKIKIVQVSDVHYIDSSLTDYGEAFTEFVEEKEGRLIRYIDRILDSFILEMINQSPDIIIFSGDLTYNGEKKSHIMLAKKLQILRKKGIDVLVIPGNHDINNSKANAFEKKEKYSVDTITKEEFGDIYRDYGYNCNNPKLLGRDKNSLSYMYLISPNKCILMLETSYGKNNMEISKQTFVWIQKMLKIAKNNNLSVISVTHENILAHNKMFIQGYKIKNSSNLIDLYSEYNVRLNLSGHMHLQHISENEGVVDSALGCIALYPNLYANIIIDDRNTIDYYTESLNVANWALKYGWKEDVLLNFEEKSKERFDLVGKKMAIPILDELDISDCEKEEMLEFMLNTVRSYFSGNLNEFPNLSIDSEIYKKWEKYCENTFSMSFLNSIYMETKKNHNRFTINK